MEFVFDVLVTAALVAIYAAALYFLSKKSEIRSRDSSVRLLIGVLVTIALAAASEALLDEPYTLVAAVAFVAIFGGALSTVFGIRADTWKGVGAVGGVACVTVITGFVIRGFQ